MNKILMLTAAAIVLTACNDKDATNTPKVVTLGGNLTGADTALNGKKLTHKTLGEVGSIAQNGKVDIKLPVTPSSEKLTLMPLDKTFLNKVFAKDHGEGFNCTVPDNFQLPATAKVEELKSFKVDGTEKMIMAGDTQNVSYAFWYVNNASNVVLQGDLTCAKSADGKTTVGGADASPVVAPEAKTVKVDVTLKPGWNIVKRSMENGKAMVKLVDMNNFTAQWTVMQSAQAPQSN